MGWRVALVQFGVQVVVAQASFGLDPVSSPCFPISHMDISFANGWIKKRTVI